MRFFTTAALLIVGATAHMTDDSSDCIDAILDSVAASNSDLCNDSNALSAVEDSIAEQCGVKPENICAGPAPAPARHLSHLSHPMERVSVNKRAFAPSMPGMPAPPAEAGRQVVYLTKTEYACNAQSTPVLDPMHVSQIPVEVPAQSSSMAPMKSMMGNMAIPTPAYSNGVLVAASSSALHASQMGAATPGPSGASAFNPFQGAAAPQVSAAYSGAAALVVATVMGMMIAL